MLNQLEEMPLIINQFDYGIDLPVTLSLSPDPSSGKESSEE
ncbi:hypothetical protein VTL71DRAFT_13058 [Oculimacula yallundae]|uniref:Uncharacterized protein n=1 Tax=Oculimacula yallundae TaxID=86028 RepID=A0ABR4CP82_9HELO